MENCLRKQSFCHTYTHTHTLTMPEWHLSSFRQKHPHFSQHFLAVKRTYLNEDKHKRDIHTRTHTHIDTNRKETLFKLNTQKFFKLKSDEKSLQFEMRFPQYYYLQLKLKLGSPIFRNPQYSQLLTIVGL